MARTFAVGDVHGNYKGLLQVLERSGFNKEEDILISLGDIADGWSQVPECVELLMSLKNCIWIKGNHDDWALKWMVDRMFIPKPDDLWYKQGGKATHDAYTIYHPDLTDKHARQFFGKQILYHIDDKNRCFVHGGFNRHYAFDDQPSRGFYWDRDLWNIALSFEAMSRGEEEGNKTKFKTFHNFTEVFIGHTTTNNWGTDKPMKAAIVWNLDTGSGFKGKLTIMDVDTKEYWQSDLVKELYPNEKGR